MEFIKEKNRVYVEVNGKTVAEVTFPSVGKDTVEINHTFVDDSLRGQGVAGQLLLAATHVIAEQDKKAIASCSYAVTWFEKHPEYQYLLKK